MKLVSSLSNKALRWVFEKLLSVLLLPLIFCLTTQVLMIKSGTTCKMRSQISQKTNDCLLLSPHLALPDYQLLLIALKSLSSKAVEQIYMSWLAAVQIGVCGGLWNLKAGAKERWQAVSMSPFDYFPYSKIKVRGDFVTYKADIEQQLRKSMWQQMSMQVLLEHPCDGVGKKPVIGRAL